MRIPSNHCPRTLGRYSVAKESGEAETVCLTEYPAVSASSFRDVAQFGSAPDWGSGGRWFESSHPDQYLKCSVLIL